MDALQETSLPRVSTDRKYQHGGLSLENRHVENKNRDNFWTVGNCDAVPTTILTFSTILTEIWHCRQFDVGRHPKHIITSGFVANIFHS